MQPTRLLAIAAIAVLASCATHSAILFDGMGDHTRKISTANSLAQRYFNQGLAMCYGFNHDEAVRSYQAVADLDPECAMAYWGQAFALSPNINLPMPDANSELAFAAIQKAMECKAGATAAERDLIDALALRFESPPKKERVHLDQAYADAMAQVWAKHPNDGDVGVLYADALMNLSPWDQWTADFKPTKNTGKILAALERVMELNPNHPGANHLYIHAVESSANPGRAEVAADRLGALIPGIGHIVHMPAHIYIQVGRFADSMACNKKASKLDRDYFARTGTQGTYHFYHAHNNHFRVWSAMYQGRYEDALESCAQTLKDLPAPFHADPGAAEWLVMDLHVHLRFGQWAAVLAAESPSKDQPYAVAMWHYARGMAFANTGKSKAARDEAAAFERVAATVPEDQKVFIVPAHDVLKVAREMLAGESAFHAGDHNKAWEHLNAAVAAEDALHYSEPSPWMMPTRHALGALLLQQGRVASAEAAYRHDLRRHPGNGWSLHGLAECLSRRGATAEAADVRKKFDATWAGATVKINASCFCRAK